MKIQVGKTRILFCALILSDLLQRKRRWRWRAAGHVHHWQTVDLRDDIECACAAGSRRSTLGGP